MEEPNYFARLADLPGQVLPNGIVARVLSGEKLTVLMGVIEPEVAPPPHAHPHEQAGIVLEGELDFMIGGEWRRLRAGDTFFIPPEVPHGVVGVRRAVTFEVFAPPREDYRALAGAEPGGGAA